MKEERAMKKERTMKKPLSVKKLLSVFVTLIMLLTTAVGEGTATAQTLANRLQALLNSIDLQRDMLTLVAGDENEQYTATLKRENDIVDISFAEIEMQEQAQGNTQVQAQFLEDQVYVRYANQVFNLKYQDLMSLVQPVNNLDMEGISTLLNLAVQKIILPYAQYSNIDGLRIIYKASGKELMTAAADLIDTALVDEQYHPAVEQLLEMMGTLTGESMPTLEQIIQSLPEAKENMLAQDPDFHVSFDLTADSPVSNIMITGEVGSSTDLYLLDWEIHGADRYLSIEGKLTNRITRQETTNDYDITVDARYDDGQWLLNISHPGQGFYLMAEGMHVDDMGTYTVEVHTRSRVLLSLYQRGNYAVTDSGITLMTNLQYLSLTGGSQDLTVTAVASNNVVDVSIVNLRLQKVLALKAQMENGTLVSLQAETETIESDITKIVYDSEQLFLYGKDMTIVCSGAMQGDNTYVVTMHPVYETLEEQPEDEDVYLKVTYEGDEGNFVITGTATDAKTEHARVELTCEPTKGVTEKLSDAEDILFLTPDVLMSIIDQSR